MNFAGDKILDTAVSPRYQFGELRLSRLNFWSKIFLQRLSFQKVYGQYGPYFARFYGPLLFIFGILSVALSAIQVALAAVTDPFLQNNRSWVIFVRVSRGFSIATIVSVVVVSLFLLVLMLCLLGRELVFAIYHLWNKCKSKDQSEEEGNRESSK